MVITLNFGGTQNNTNATTSYPNNFVWTTGYAFPSGNNSLEGNSPVRINSLTASHASGASGIYYRLVRSSTVYSAGNIVTISGGAFQFRIGYSSGTLSFGRDDNSGGVVTDNGDGSTWAGRLTGTMTWSTVPSVPASLTAARNGRSVTLTRGNSGGDGSSTITGYRSQYSRNGGSWSTAVSMPNATYTYSNLTSGSYVFRVYAVNANGNSGARSSSTVAVPNTVGNRHNGSSFIDLSTTKRYTGSSWVDLTTMKRYSGSAWVDISN